ncbi:hypothetical protein O181_101731 [Austropuccinia psidii MF-1]|uniref:Uncharacterized protein n=1 Tax=Austropuccinia psidii MF-1 TaxID=1389203 RepID=A0A9Q3JHA9_9BASI|nr:hypothetical protein [Austropuccinia psidii MF-1]
MVNIDPRLIMQDKDITQLNLQNSKIGIRKSEQDLSKELIQEPKEEPVIYLQQKNNLFHISTSNKDPIFPEYPQHLEAFSPKRKVKNEIRPGNKVIKQVMTAEKERDITKNEDLIKPKPKYSTNIEDHIEQDFMENYPHQNEICRSRSIRQSTNTKKEDSPTPHYHSDRDNPDLILETNYFSLDKAKEIRMKKNEEISEEISTRQGTQDQKTLSKKKMWEKLKQMGFYLQNTNFPGKAIPIGSL